MPVFIKATVQQLLITLHCLHPFYESFLHLNFIKLGTSEAVQAEKVGARH